MKGSMQKDKKTLIKALKETVDRLKNGAKYEWGHMGRCNAGHIVQTLTGMSDYDIVKSVNFEMDEWTEHAKGFCDKSNENVEDIFLNMKEVGLSYQDIIHLENLSDKVVLKNLKGGFRYLKKNNRDDLIDYISSLANTLEKENA
jgi:hypothetical protein